jgi:hypothetical protein
VPDWIASGIKNPSLASFRSTCSDFSPVNSRLWSRLVSPSRRIIPVRWIGEQHVRENLGFIPSFADWVRAIRPEPWMGRAQKLHADEESGRRFALPTQQFAIISSESDFAWAVASRAPCRITILPTAKAPVDFQSESKPTSVRLLAGGAKDARRHW